jgi:hypothetical protein
VRTELPPPVSKSRMSIRALAPLVAAGLIVVGAPLAGRLRAQAGRAAHPDFAGTWVYDTSKNTAGGTGQNGPVSAPMLGDRVTIVQDATEITMTIANGAQLVTARYKLDGSESRNVSPAGNGQADIVVTSHAAWAGATLVIDSSSASILRGQPVPVQTKRVLTIDADGFLTMDRTGTPPGLVVPTRSVYRRNQE